jgi:hypothetical protein
MPAAFPPFFWPLDDGDEAPPGQPPPGVEVLGHDGGRFLVLAADGSVVAVDPEGRHTELFVNSTEQEFVDALALLRAAWEVRAELPENEAEEQARRLGAEVAAVDEPAVADGDRWWPLVLEQLEDGLL